MHKATVKTIQMLRIHRPEEEIMDEPSLLLRRCPSVSNLLALTEEESARLQLESRISDNHNYSMHNTNNEEV